MDFQANVYMEKGNSFPWKSVHLEKSQPYNHKTTNNVHNGIQSVLICLVILPNGSYFWRKVEPLLACTGPAEPQVPWEREGRLDRPRLRFRACGASSHWISGLFRKNLSQTWIFRQMCTWKKGTIFLWKSVHLEKI